MYRLGRKLPASPVRRRQATRICAGAMAMAGCLYVASPYVALWSMGAALQRNDRGALCSSLDWEQVRAGLKDSLGLQRPVRQVSQQDELPDFGTSFVSNVASGMIDDDITPERIDTMLSGLGSHADGTTTLPHGFFAGPARFEVQVGTAGRAPIRITMRIEKWRWKITRITLPESMLNPAAATHVARS
jgi:hypothetical protein